jgi:hypothetical protein
LSFTTLNCQQARKRIWTNHEFTLIIWGSELQSKKHCRSNWEMVLEENRSAIRKQLPMLHYSYNVKKVMKIAKGQSESIYMHRRRTDTTIVKRKRKKHKQRSTKHTYKTSDRVTRTLLKTGDELTCSGSVSSSCSTRGSCRVNLITNPVISHEWGMDREVLTTNGTYPWSLVTYIFLILSFIIYI